MKKESSKKKNIDNIKKEDTNEEITMNDLIKEQEKFKENILNEKVIKEESPLEKDISEEKDDDKVVEKDNFKDIKEKKNGLYYTLIIITFITFVSYVVIEVLHIDTFKNFLPKLVGIVFIFLVLICFSVMSIRSKEKRFSIIIFCLLFITYSIFNILLTLGKIELPIEEFVPNFYDKTMIDVNTWKEINHIDIIENYEYSDKIAKYHIISQDVSAPTLTKDITKLLVTISLGPDYEKEVIVPNFVGLSRDEVIKYAQENYLSNVSFVFIDSEKKVDTVISQNESGTMKRNTTLILNISKNNSNEDVKIIDLTKKSKLYATSWLESFGFKVNIIEEYSDDIMEGYVIKQSIKDEVKSPLDTEVDLTISKGKMLISPDIMAMSQSEINEWIINNNLKVSYKEEYSEDKPLGEIINSSIKKDDIIEKSKLIEITISKGKLEMIEYTTITEFTNWAETNNIDYEIKYEYSDTIKKDFLISSSHKKGETIKKNDTVTITLSSGRSITIPNFIGMSKTSIQNKCNELNLSCSFKTGSYTEKTAKDIAIAQSKNANVIVSEGTNLVITLSAGIIQKVNVPNMVGKTKTTIQNECKNLGITCNFNYQSGYSNTAKDTCVSQSKTGTVNYGSSITITLSNGPAKTYTVIIDANQLSSGNPQATKATLEAKLKNACPGVTFNFKFEKANSGIGYLSPNSGVKIGANTFTQGQTYTVIINSN